jgi:hypothetical protein
MKKPFIAVPKLVSTLLKPVPVLIKLLEVATPELQPISMPTVAFIIVLRVNVPVPVAEIAVPLPLNLLLVTLSPAAEVIPGPEVFTIVFPEIVAPPPDAIPTPPPLMKLPDIVTLPPCVEMAVGAPRIEFPWIVTASAPLLTEV